MPSTLHAHVFRAESDCDGPIQKSYIETLNDAERLESDNEVNDFHDINFKERILGETVSVFSSGTLDVTPNGATWNEPTEEGHRYTEIQWCEDAECDPDVSTYRDIQAEGMGY